MPIVSVIMNVKLESTFIPELQILKYFFTWNLPNEVETKSKNTENIDF
jgi:hypothetical protein